MDQLWVRLLTHTVFLHPPFQSSFFLTWPASNKGIDNGFFATGKEAHLDLYVIFFRFFFSLSQFPKAFGWGATGRREANEREIKHETEQRKGNHLPAGQEMPAMVQVNGHRDGHRLAAKSGAPASSHAQGLQ